MPSKNARVTVVLERPLYDALGRLARRQGETHEDLVLAEIALERERTPDRSKTLTHDTFWRRGLKSNRR